MGHGDSNIHSCTMKVVSILGILGLGLALALPQYKQQDKGQHGENLDDEGPNQDKKVKLEPSFDSVKQAAENELEEGRDNKLEQDPVFDAVKDAQEPKKCAKDGVSDLNRSKIEDMIKEAKEDKEAFEKKSESCKKRGKLDCCEGYYCAVTAFSNCRSIP